MAASSGTTEAQMRSEIERLTATIKQHKELQNQQASWKEAGHNAHYYHGPGPTRSNKYVNPSYQPPNKYVRPGVITGSVIGSPSIAAALVETNSDSGPSVPQISQPPPVIPGQKKEVVLGGVAFESSGRSLVRKDLPKALSTAKTTTTSKPTTSLQITRKPGHVLAGRAFKLKARRGRNMTLNNGKRPYQSRKTTAKRKFIDKPCARFTTTGACSRGLTCPYRHDPSKIAICWNYLQDNCSSSAETCNLSHDPTPERTPLCVHFLNKGRCTREKCPFPHVNVGQRQGVCRDFAVLGYCERGLDCDHQHVRECPDFAEKGTCETKGCKLPHVIRANRNRKMTNSGNAEGEKKDAATAEDAQLGDEFISLTFRESDSDDDEEEDNQESDEEMGEDDDVIM